MIGPTYASSTVVEIRGYSRMTGRISLDNDMRNPALLRNDLGRRAARAPDRRTRTGSTPRCFHALGQSRRTAVRISSSASGATAGPSESTRSIDLLDQVLRNEQARLLVVRVDQVGAARPRPAAQLVDRAEALRDEQAGPHALALEHRVGRDRRAVHDIAMSAAETVRRRASPPPRSPRAMDRGHRGHLGPTQVSACVLERDEIGECPAGIDADEPVCHANRPSIVFSRSSRCKLIVRPPSTGHGITGKWPAMLKEIRYPALRAPSWVAPRPPPMIIFCGRPAAAARRLRSRLYRRGSVSSPGTAREEHTDP